MRLFLLRQIERLDDSGISRHERAPADRYRHDGRLTPDG